MQRNLFQSPKMRISGYNMDALVDTRGVNVFQSPKMRISGYNIVVRTPKPYISEVSVPENED